MGASELLNHFIAIFTGDVLFTYDDGVSNRI